MADEWPDVCIWDSINRSLAAFRKTAADHSNKEEAMENNKLLEIAKEYAAKYAAEELEVLKRMVSIDSGTGNIEGNAKVVAVAEEVLS